MQEVHPPRAGLGPRAGPGGEQAPQQRAHQRRALHSGAHGPAPLTPSTARHRPCPRRCPRPPPGRVPRGSSWGPGARERGGGVGRSRVGRRPGSWLAAGGARPTRRPVWTGCQPQLQPSPPHAVAWPPPLGPPPSVVCTLPRRSAPPTLGPAALHHPPPCAPSVAGPLPCAPTLPPPRQSPAPRPPRLDGVVHDFGGRDVELGRAINVAWGWGGTGGGKRRVEAGPAWTAVCAAAGGTRAPPGARHPARPPRSPPQALGLQVGAHGGDVDEGLLDVRAWGVIMGGKGGGRGVGRRGGRARAPRGDRAERA